MTVGLEERIGVFWGEVFFCNEEYQFVCKVGEHHRGLLVWEIGLERIEAVTAVDLSSRPF